MLKVDLKYISLNENGSSRELLSNIKFIQNSGEILTILGKNGAGKSTLIKSLTQLLNKSIYSIKGEAYFNDLNLITCGEDELQKIRKEKIKYVFQDSMNSFNPLKKLEYYFKNLLNEQNNIDKLLTYFLLPSKNELVKMHSYEISGGMAQRLAIALALAIKPDLLILDEPTSAVDAAGVNMIANRVKEYSHKENMMVLIITQEFNFAEEVSDKIALLSDGKLSEFYTPEKFKQNYKAFTELV